MSGPVSRLTLPENFFDVTSAALLLQPEPQYLFASLWKRAMGQDLGVPDAIGLELPDRSVTGVGADYAQRTDGRLMLATDLFDSLIGAKFDMEGMPGHSVFVNRPKFANTTYTTTARKVSQNTAISTTAIGVGSEQVGLTLQRFAGPYDQDNSRVAPYGLDAFDAKVGVHKVSKIVGLNMQRDFDKFVETVMVGLGDTAATVVRPAGMTTDNTPTVVGANPLDYDTINRAEESADTNNIPCFPDGYRLLAVTPTQARQLKNDSQFARYAEFHRDMNALFPGYLTSVNKLHVFKSTTLTTTANSSSIAIHRAQLLAPGAFASALGGRPYVAKATDDNYGLTPKVIWIMHADWLLADNRFVLSVRSSA